MSTEDPVKVELDWFQLIDFREHKTINGILAFHHATENVRSRGEVAKPLHSKGDALQIHLTSMNVLNSNVNKKVSLLFVVDYADSFFSNNVMFICFVVVNLYARLL
jgi:hypothetical protein